MKLEGKLIAKVAIIALVMATSFIGCGSDDENTNPAAGSCFVDSFGRQICPQYGQVPFGGIPGSQDLFNQVNALGSWTADLYLNGKFKGAATVSFATNALQGATVTIVHPDLNPRTSGSAVFQAGVQGFNGQLISLRGMVFYTGVYDAIDTTEKDIDLSYVTISGGRPVQIEFFEWNAFNQDSYINNFR